MFHTARCAWCSIEYITFGEAYNYESARSSHARIDRRELPPPRHVPPPAGRFVRPPRNVKLLLSARRAGIDKRAACRESQSRFSQKQNRSGYASVCGEGKGRGLGAGIILLFRFLCLTMLFRSRLRNGILWCRVGRSLTRAILEQKCRWSLAVLLPLLQCIIAYFHRIIAIF